MDQATESMIRNLEQKTGKLLSDWIAIAKKSGFKKHGEITKYLKSEYGIGHGYANLIAFNALAGDAPQSESDLVDAQYSGEKAGLRPIYEKVASAVQAFGSDVEIAPKKTCVSFRRNKQFALIQASTKTRVDLGINLKGVEAKGRLEKSGSFNAMVSHRVRLESAKDVDSELMGWLKSAYEQS